MNIVAKPSRSLGYQQIVGAAAATGLTVPASTCMALINIEAQAVRWRDDGTNPTTTVGMNQAVGSTLEFYGDFGRIKFIETTAGTIINVAYYGI